jgi:Bifunctional DNA primase/polymerase, N-terminal
MTTALEHPAVVVPQPNERGEFASPADGAKFMASFNIPQIPLDGKVPRKKGWQNIASTDFAQIDTWAQEFPGCNFGSVAKAIPGGFFALEIDSSEVSRNFKADTGKEFSSTLRIRSGSDRGHHWYLQSPESLELSNIGQQVQKGDQGFSFRWNNEQCVSPGSIHPIRKTQYKVAKSGPPSVAAEQDISWIKSKVNEVAKKGPVTLDGPPIPHGQHDSELTRIGGKLRHVGMEQDSIATALIEVCEKRCENYGSDYREMCEKIARSVCRYPIGKDDTVLFDSQPVGRFIAPVEVAAPFEIDTNDLCVRPEFPNWVMSGTTLYENLVGPAIASSSKHPEFIFMAGIQTMLNYLSGKVRMNFQNTNLNMFLGFVSPYGQFFKSSSAKLAHNYFQAAGILQAHSGALRNAEGKVITMQAGSPEGFGLAMSKVAGNHAILFNDELGHIAGKAIIKSSVFLYNMLSWYESGSFGNVVKSSKDSFSFESNNYWFGWLFCVTDRGFNRLWPQLADISSGLIDRMFLVVSPEKPKENSTYSDPCFRDSVAATKDAMNRAIDKGVYENENIEDVRREIAGLDPRSQQLLQALALYFCIDLRKDEVDSDCLERAKALIEYRNQAIQFLAPIEADTQLGRVQKEIMREVRQHRGKMSKRELCRNLDYTSYGSDLWNNAYKGIVYPKGDILMEWEERSPSGRTMKMVGLIKHND